MILRLRSRDGLERIVLPDGAGTAALRDQIHAQLGIPLEDMTLSRDPALLTAKGGLDGISVLPAGDAPLASLGVAHGDMVYMLYHFERQVEPAVAKTLFDRRQFGAHVSVHDIAAKQRRIERQDKPKVESCSFDRNAANVFQSYVQSALAFSIKRGGILYGTVDEGKNVRVEFVYEPPQEGGPEALALERGTPEEAQVDFLAELFGLKKVGWVFAQSNKQRDWIVSGSEVLQMAAMQGELGEQSVTVVVSFDPNEQGGHVHFEAFQCTDQAVELAKGGWFKGEAPGEGGGGSGGVEMVSPTDPTVKEPAIVAGKDAAVVDSDWFLCPLKILDHEGPFMAAFPVENRLIPQTKGDLRDHLRRLASKPYEARLSDLHLLLWLSRQPTMDPGDVLAVCGAVREGRPLLEGYRVIIDSLAGLG
ncbi:MAG: NPL4 family-domain-containing protein [Monoraphidium minutum]|nr:MAG: NPL4 family-domain-containing protein [Monoraphidium minutum]